MALDCRDQPLASTKEAAARASAVREMIDDLEEDLLRELPIEIWTESDIGQTLLDMAHRGLCRYTRLNSTLGRFERNGPELRVAHEG